MNRDFVDSLLSENATEVTGFPAGSTEPGPEHNVAVPFSIGSGRDTTEPRQVAVVGGGPGGYTAAIALANQGWEVTLFEKRPDPRHSKVDDSRSFNLTLAGLGLSASGKLEPTIEATGQRVIGRRVYVGNSVFDRPYGCSAKDYFISIPRHTLAGIQATEAMRAGVRIHFEHEVLDANPQTGQLAWRSCGGQKLQYGHFDLLILADGVAGLGRTLLWKQPLCFCKKDPDETAYVKAALTAEDVKEGGMSLRHISFWTSRQGPVIGIPNTDGSINLLLMSTLPHGGGRVPFRNEKEGAVYLRRFFPRLLGMAPRLPAILAGAPCGYFCTATATHWLAGSRAAVLGDAGRCVPPYAGAGAAAAMDDAQILARFIFQYQSLDKALHAYQENRRVAAKVFVKMAEPHGRFLKSGIGSFSWRAESRLKLLVEKYLNRRDLYQRIVFERDGLERLVAKEMRAERLRSTAAYPPPFCW